MQRDDRLSRCPHLWETVRTARGAGRLPLPFGQKSLPLGRCSVSVLSEVVLMEHEDPHDFWERLYNEREWETVRAAQAARTATGPDGQTGELLDSVVLLRRR